MAKIVSIDVTEAFEDVRADSFLVESGCYPTRSKAVKFIDAGKVFVNGNVPDKKTKVHTGDVVVYEEFELSAPAPVIGEQIDLDVVYEDDFLIVLNKQAGLICHPSQNHPDHTLVNALVHRYGWDGLAKIQGDDRPGIVHRLDGDTSGLMLCAKTDTVGFELQDQIRARSVDRRYITLVHGVIAQDTGLIDAPIFRSDKDRLRMTVSDKPQARSSITTFKVLERFSSGNNDEGYSLVECKLYTGRTHQIRVHMEYIRHWLVGDATYGNPGKCDDLGLTRQFLHSYSIGFEHPETGEELSFTADLPEDLQAALNKLYGRSIELTEYGAEALHHLRPEAADTFTLDA